MNDNNELNCRKDKRCHSNLNNNEFEDSFIALTDKKIMDADNNSEPVDTFYIQLDRKIISNELIQRDVKGRQFSHGEQFFNFLYLPDKMTSFPTEIKNRLEKYFEYLLTTEDQTLGIYNTDSKVFSCSDFQIKYLQRGHLRDVYFELIDDEFIKEVSLDSDDLPPYFKNLFNKTEIIERYMVESEELNRDRHDRLEKLLLNDLDNVFAIEPPVFNKSVSIAGHIDFLSFSFRTERFRLQISDYKPVDAGREYEFVKSLPQLCMYALLLNRILNVTDSDLLECVMFNKHKAIIFKPNLIKVLPEILAPHYNLARFGQDPIDFLGNVRDYMYLDWVLLSGLESLYQPPMNRFNTIELELLNALNLDLNGGVNDIALSLNNIALFLKNNLSSITPEQSDCLDSILTSVQILLNQSIKPDDLFYEFFTTYDFNPDIWETSLPSSCHSNLRILLKINKLKIVFLRLKFKIAGYQYYTLVALYSLERATNSQLTFTLINSFGFSNLISGITFNFLDSLIKKKFIEKFDDKFYILTKKGRLLLFNLNVKKDLNVLFERNYLLLKKRFYALEILKYLYINHRNDALTNEIKSNIRSNIKGKNNSCLDQNTLDINIAFLIDYQFINKLGYCNPVVDLIFNCDRTDLRVIPSEIKFLDDILIAIHSMDFARFSYIFDYINSINNKNSPPNILSHSLDKLLSNNFIEKQNSFYFLTKKGVDYFIEKDLQNNSELKFFYNIKDFEDYYKYTLSILVIIKNYNLISLAKIQRKIKSQNLTSKYGIVSKAALLINLKALITMEYISKGSNYPYQYYLTDSGNDLFKKSEFTSLIKGIKLDDVVPTLEEIQNLRPKINVILKFISSIEKPSYIIILKSMKSFKIKESEFNSLIGFLKRCNFIEFQNHLYILTEEGKEYLNNY
ncbi:MAG: hypothetical protein CEE42_07965 [Promethearchaeota archaeon Loki_b31]|nr:MAG: hypothetical protein CEE42_07965 [Candidatus Lokiarchaeota archaeon Loki_b31]